MSQITKLETIQNPAWMKGFSAQQAKKWVRIEKEGQIALERLRKEREHYNQEHETDSQEILKLREEISKLKERNGLLKQTTALISIENMDYLQKMIKDDAFEKMMEQYKILDLVISTFFLMFQDFGDGAKATERKGIIDNSYNLSQAVLKVWNNFSESFQPIFELDIHAPEQNKKEEN
jgi:hypothetical protein